MVRREEGQFLHAFLPQIQQHGGVNHGNGEAAQPAALPGGEVLCRPAVISLEDRSVSAQEGVRRRRHFLLSEGG